MSESKNTLFSLSPLAAESVVRTVEVSVDRTMCAFHALIAGVTALFQFADPSEMPPLGRGSVFPDTSS
jgi:hypothetical protein